VRTTELMPDLSACPGPAGRSAAGIAADALFRHASWEPYLEE
jgi:hypothetical protein